MIEFENVTKRYPGAVDALSHVNFVVEQGQMVFLTGHSGAGKSTLLRLLGLLERPSSGRILYNQHCLSRLPTRKIPQVRRSMGLIFQEPHLLADRDVFQNVALPLMVVSHHRHEVAKRTRAALDMVGLLDKEKLSPMVLSTGERQRIGIARAMVHRPSLLLADEPTGNLDPVLAEEIIRLFVRMNEFGVTVLIATHNLSLTAQLPYPIFVLKRGRLIC